VKKGPKIGYLVISLPYRTYGHNGGMGKHSSAVRPVPTH
jgi:hypothetical protein